MSKITRRDNIRVTIEPYVFGKWDENYAITKANEIRDAVKRHIDDVKSVDVEWDNVSVCSHCGYTWEEDPETNEPQCCRKAQEEFNNAKEQAK